MGHQFEANVVLGSLRNRFTLNSDVGQLPYNRAMYGDLGGMAPEQHQQRFNRWWFWSEHNGLNNAEYLLPQLRVQTEIRPFSFERRFAAEKRAAPPQREIDRLAPWAYQVEFGDTSTLGVRNDAEWKYHRYRAGLLVDTAAAIAGDRIQGLSVIDAGCHCGVFSLELAERGFGHVTGTDLRAQNISQAQFLARTLDVEKVEFIQKNARFLREFGTFDVVFCGGLLYHVTFPMELLASLFMMTKDFLILDTLTHKYSFSGFHLVCNKNVDYSAEGEFHYEFHPTYRAVCDALYAVGFKQVYEIVGDKAGDVPSYKTGNVRSFVASKSEGGMLRDFISSL